MQDPTGPIIGRLLIVTGLVLVAVGAIVIWGRVFRLGSLPGDFTWSGRGWQVSLPLATCVILSVVMTLALNLLARRR
jgi:hypothetical protein